MKLYPVVCYHWTPQEVILENLVGCPNCGALVKVFQITKGSVYGTKVINCEYCGKETRFKGSMYGRCENKTCYYYEEQKKYGFRNREITKEVKK